MKRLLVILASLFLASMVHAETWPLAAVKGVLPLAGRHVAVVFVSGSAFAGLAECFEVNAGNATLVYREGGAPGPAQQGQTRADQVRSTYRTSWQCADSTTQEVVTPCATFREPLDCAHAHKAGVDAMKALFPPVPPRQ